MDPSVDHAQNTIKNSNNSNNSNNANDSNSSNNSRVMVVVIVMVIILGIVIITVNRPTWFRLVSCAATVNSKAAGVLAA